MTRLIDALRTRPGPDAERYSLQQYVADVQAQFGGFTYPLGGSTQGPPGVPSEPAPGNFEGIVRQVYYRNGIVAGCMTARRALFGEARLKWRNLTTKKLYGDQNLEPLESPWPNGSTGDLLARFEQDDSLAGNAYVIRESGRLNHVRPDYMSIVLGSNLATEDGQPGYEVADAPDCTVVGYAYWPGGAAGKYRPRIYLPADVAHYAPEPDPLAHFRGESWLRQVLLEVDTDRQLMEHKAGFLERGATPSFAIKYPPETTRGDGGEDNAKRIIEMFREQHEGAANSWKALHLFGGADPVTLGVNFRDLDYKAVVGAGETRIAMRARVPATTLGISEGLGGSALNQGNWNSARRQFGEQYAYPNWRQACEALSVLVRVPAGSELWYDTADVAYLHEDARDAAEVLSTNATAIRTLTDGGYEAASVIAAVTGGDLSLLKHSGLVPVQLQPPGQNDPKMNGAPAQPATNGAA